MADTRKKDELLFDAIEDCITSFAQGNFIVVLDSAARENEGDLIMAAEDITTEKMAFMIRFTSGVICAPLLASRATYLELPLLVPEEQSSDPHKTAYTISVDAEAPSCTTGISAHDRALACRTLASPSAKPKSFRRPGHLFPLIAKSGGVKERRGHTEAAVELSRLAGKSGVAVISELILQGQQAGSDLVDADYRIYKKFGNKTELRGSGMMRRDDCIKFARSWELKVCTIEALIEFLQEVEPQKKPRKLPERIIPRRAHTTV